MVRALAGQRVRVGFGLSSFVGQPGGGKGSSGLLRASSALGVELGACKPHLHSMERFHGVLILQGSRFCREVKLLTQDDTSHQQERQDSNLGLETFSGHRLYSEGYGQGAQPSQHGCELCQPPPVSEGRNQAAGPSSRSSVPLRILPGPPERRWAGAVPKGGAQRAAIVLLRPDKGHSVSVGW